MKKIIDFLNRYEFLTPRREEGGHVQIGLIAALILYLIFYKLGVKEPQRITLLSMIFIAIVWEIAQHKTNTGTFSLKDIFFTIEASLVVFIITELTK